MIGRPSLLINFVKTCQKRWHLYKQQKYVYKESINYRTILFIYRQIILCFILWPESKVSFKNSSFSADFSKKSKKRQFANLWSSLLWSQKRNQHQKLELCNSLFQRNSNMTNIASREKYLGGSQCHRHNRTRHPRWSMKPDYKSHQDISNVNKQLKDLSDLYSK